MSLRSKKDACQGSALQTTNHMIYSLASHLSSPFVCLLLLRQPSAALAPDLIMMCGLLYPAWLSLNVSFTMHHVK
jgi:hypothetical protein